MTNIQAFSEAEAEFSGSQSKSGKSTKTGKASSKVLAQQEVIITKLKKDKVMNTALSKLSVYSGIIDQNGI
jgi:hypothetical protein